MMPGFIVQQRNFFAKVALWFPGLTQLLIWVRWILWVCVGWPIPGFAVLVYIGVAVVITAAGVGPAVMFAAGVAGDVVGWLWATAPRNGWGAVWLAVVFGLTVGSVKVARMMAAQPVQAATGRKLNRLALSFAVNAARAGLQWGTAAAVVLYNVWTIGGGWVTAMALWVAAGFCVDVIVARDNGRMALVRRWAQWRRETPTVFAVIAAQTPSYQSGTESSVEQNLTLAAKLRPILEHPAVNLFPRFRWDENVVTHRAFPTPGRGLDKLEEVLPVWSGQMPTIEDYPDSMSLHPDSGTDVAWASAADFDVHFKAAGRVERFPMPRRLAAWFESRRPAPVFAGADPVEV